MIEYVEPEDADGLAAAKGFHYRDRGGMLSALAAPLPVFGQEVYPGVHLKAAVLISAINHNHPMLDGNKRMSWYLTVAFYEFNGYDLYADADEGERYVKLIAGETPPPIKDVEMWLDKHSRPTSPR